MNFEIGKQISGVKLVDGVIILMYVNGTEMPMKKTVEEVTTTSMFNIQNGYFTNNTPSNIHESSYLHLDINKDNGGVFRITPPTTEAFVEKSDSNITSKVFRNKGDRQLYTGTDTKVDAEDFLKPRLTFKGINRPISTDISTYPQFSSYEYIGLCIDNPKYAVYNVLHTDSKSLSSEDSITIEYENSGEVVPSGGSHYSFNPLVGISGSWLVNDTVSVTTPTADTKRFAVKSHVVEDYYHTSGTYYTYEVVDLASLEVITKSKEFRHSHSIIFSYDERCSFTSDLFVTTSDKYQVLRHFELSSVANSFTINMRRTYTITSIIDWENAERDKPSVVHSNLLGLKFVAIHTVNLPNTLHDMPVVGSSTYSHPYVMRERGMVFYYEAPNLVVRFISTGLVLVKSLGIEVYTDNIAENSDGNIVIGAVKGGYDVTGRIRTEEQTVEVDPLTLFINNNYRATLPYTLLTTQWNKVGEVTVANYITGIHSNVVHNLADKTITESTEGYTCTLNGTEITKTPNTMEDMLAYYGELKAIAEYEYEYVNKVKTYFLYSDKSEGDCYEYEWTNSSGTIVGTSWMTSVTRADIYYLKITSVEGVESVTSIRCDDSTTPIREGYYNPTVYLRFKTSDGKIVSKLIDDSEVIIDVLFSTPTVLGENVYTLNGQTININMPVLLKAENILTIKVAAVDNVVYIHNINFTTISVIRYIIGMTGNRKLLLQNFSNPEYTVANLFKYSTLFRNLDAHSVPLEVTHNGVKNQLDVQSDSLSVDITSLIVETGDYTFGISDTKYSFSNPPTFTVVDSVYRITKYTLRVSNLVLVPPFTHLVEVKYTPLIINVVENSPEILASEILYSIELLDGTVVKSPSSPSSLTYTHSFTLGNPDVDTTYVVRCVTTNGSAEVIEPTTEITILHVDEPEAINVTITELIGSIAWENIPSEQEVNTLTLDSNNPTTIGMHTSSGDTDSCIIEVDGVSSVTKVLLYSESSPFLKFNKPNAFIKESSLYKTITSDSTVTIEMYFVTPTLPKTTTPTTTMSYYVDGDDSLTATDIPVGDVVFDNVFNQAWIDTYNEGNNYIKFYIVSKNSLGTSEERTLELVLT